MSPPPRPPLVTLVAIALALPGRLARAEGTSVAPAPWTLQWSAPTECPSRGDLEKRLAELLATSHPTQTMTARVDVEKEHGSFHAHLHTRIGDARGERTLVASTCDLVTSAAALVLALTLDPDLRVPAPEPSSPPPEPAPPPLAPVPVVPIGATPLPRTAAWSFTLAPRVGVDEGTLPSLASGGGLTLGARHGAVAVEAYGEAWLSAHAASDSLAGAGGTFTLVDVGARGCLRTPGELRAGGCAGAEVDRMHGAGFGVTNPGSANRAWITPRLGGEIAWAPAASIEVPLAIDLLVPLARPTFALRNAGTVFVPSAVGLRASIGVTFRFR